MARIRTIKPEFWTDETIVELDYPDRLLFIGLWNFADDQGFMPFRPKRIKMQVFPGDDYDVTAGIRRLWESSLVSLYAHADGVLLHIKHWARHQKISNPAREKYSASDLQLLPEWSTDVPSPLESYPAEWNGREGKGRETSAADAASDDADAPPSREDVLRLCNHLADRIADNGSKRPSIGKGWYDAARLILDRDGRTEAEVHKAIDWCQDDEFWRSNILSMPTLRAKYDQLRLQAQSRRGSHNLSVVPTGPITGVGVEWENGIKFINGQPVMPAMPDDKR
jgi:hypothetical protein